MEGESKYGEKISGGYYRDSDHSYFNEQGVRVPSVTQVFDLLGMTDFEGIPQETLEWKREFGTAVHTSVEFLVQNNLDWDSCDERIIPAVTGIEQKLKQMKFVSHACEEKRIYSIHGMQFGGSLDHRGTCVHQGVERHCVIDLKTALKAEPYWKWQVSAYTAGLEKNEKPWLGIVLQVGKDGAVVPHYYDTFIGLREFQVLLAACLLKLNNGLGKLRNGNG